MADSGNGSESTKGELVGVAKELATLIRAKYPVLGIVSPEERRVEYVIQRAVATLTHKLPNGTELPAHQVLWWSMTQGVWNVPDPDPNSSDHEQVSEITGFRAALEWFRKHPGRVVLIARDGMQHLMTDDPATLRELRDTARWCKRTEPKDAHVLILVSSALPAQPQGARELPKEIEGDVHMLEFERPNREEIAQILEGTLAHLPETVQQATEKEQVVSAALGMTAAEAQSAFARSIVIRKRIDPDLVLGEKKQMVRRSHSLEWVEPLEGGLVSVAGLDIAKETVEETLDVFSEDARRAGIDRPKGLFAGGVPGTGKSYLFAAIVAALRVPGVRMNVGRLFGSLMGESERKLHEDKLLLRALAPCAVQIDEFDKAFGGGGDQDGNTSGRVRGEFLTFLQDRGGADVYFYATANNLEMLFERSPEMMRQGRWDDLLFFDLPILEERAQMFEVHARKRRVAGLDAFRLAGETDKFLPAEIENVLVKGMRRAFRDGRRPVTTDDLLRQVDQRRNSILAVTAKERIAGMRKWAKGRMTFASSAQEKVVASVTKMVDEGLRGLEA